MGREREALPIHKTGFPKWSPQGVPKYFTAGVEKEEHLVISYAHSGSGIPRVPEIKSTR